MLRIVSLLRTALAGAAAVGLLGGGSYLAWRQSKRSKLPKRSGAARARAEAPLTEAAVQQALTAAEGNVRRAAGRLGTTEKTLHEKLRRWPELRQLGWDLRLQHSKTGFGRPPYKEAEGRGRFQAAATPTEPSEPSEEPA